MVVDNTKQDFIERVSKKAGDYEEMSVNCAQGTIAALAEEFDFDGMEELIKSASFFPGIMLRGETCGAVTGGLMALGMALGREKLSDPSYKTPEAAEELLRRRTLVWNFCEEFKEKWGSTMCNCVRPAIMGRDYNTMIPEERVQFINDGGAKQCRQPPEFAARLIAEILLAEGIEPKRK